MLLEGFAELCSRMRTDTAAGLHVYIFCSYAKSSDHYIGSPCLTIRPGVEVWPRIRSVAWGA